MPPTRIVFALLASLLALANIAELLAYTDDCPESACNGQAGCPSEQCPCTYQGTTYTPPPYPVASGRPGCPDCDPIPHDQCRSTYIDFDLCYPLSSCR